MMDGDKNLRRLNHHQWVKVFLVLVLVAGSAHRHPKSDIQERCLAQTALARSQLNMPLVWEYEWSVDKQESDSGMGDRLDGGRQLDRWQQMEI
jgi:hypothetical protein